MCEDGFQLGTQQTFTDGAGPGAGNERPYPRQGKEMGELLGPKGHIFFISVLSVPVT